MPIQSISKTVIGMGHGDILTGFVIDPHGGGHFCFQAAGETQVPGTPAPHLDGKYSLGDADVVIAFENVEAVERVMASLGQLKRAMLRAAQ
jgi:hypothetical protein